ncbi:MAG: hypothetical protein QE263_02065 [Vampirovibrionales bacterium]|nr:hypothetical protein [Vampirovibrionales bacterium]
MRKRDWQDEAEEIYYSPATPIGWHYPYFIQEARGIKLSWMNSGQLVSKNIERLKKYLEPVITANDRLLYLNPSLPDYRRYNPLLEAISATKRWRAFAHALLLERRSPSEAELQAEAISLPIFSNKEAKKLLKEYEKTGTLPVKELGILPLTLIKLPGNEPGLNGKLTVEGNSATWNQFSAPLTPTEAGLLKKLLSCSYAVPESLMQCLAKELEDKERGHKETKRPIAKRISELNKRLLKHCGMPPEHPKWVLSDTTVTPVQYYVPLSYRHC